MVAAAGAIKKTRLSRQRSPRLLDVSVPIAAKRIAHDWLDDLRAARRRLPKANDPEALHDFRVALRRLRSTLRAYQPWFGPPAAAHKLRKRLKRLARASGRARDLEVGLEWLKRERRKFPARQQPAFDRLIAEFESRQTAAEAELRSRLEENFDALDRRVEAARRHIDARVPALPLARVAARLIERQVTALGAELNRIASVSDTRTIHSARIEAKRLRYLLEPMAPELGNGAALIRTLKRFQDDLGLLCDRQVLSAHLIDLAARYQMERTVRGLQSAAGDTASTPKRSAMPVLRRLVEHLGRDREQRFRAIKRRYLGAQLDSFLAPYRRVAGRLADRSRPPTAAMPTSKPRRTAGQFPSHDG